MDLDDDIKHLFSSCNVNSAAPTCAIPPLFRVRDRSVRAGCVEVVEDPLKGFCLVAAENISQGSVVLTDVSLVSCVTEMRYFREALWKSCSAAAKGLAMEVAEKKLFSTAASALQLAERTYGVGFAHMQHLSFVASLLIQYGDVNTWFPGDKTDSSTVKRHKEAEAAISELRTWWQCTVRDEDIHIATCILSLFPSSLIRCDCRSCGFQDCSVGGLDACLACGSTIQGVGFFSRHGLHDPRKLAELLAAVNGNAVDVAVPGLPNRVALFPKIRLCEHECRPSCTVAIVDSPQTHADAPAKSEDQGEHDDDYDKELKNRKVKRSDIVISRETAVRPSVALLVAARDLVVGDRISIAYIPSSAMTQPQRQVQLFSTYGFHCTCPWCTTEPDLPRAFRCPVCPKNAGVISPVGDGTKLWQCLNCGTVPGPEQIVSFIDAEKALSSVKADKLAGISKLLDNELVHYTHCSVFRKLDQWSERAWVEQDAKMAINYIETLIKCAERIMQPGDPSLAQYHEFLGQVHHAVGNAHTAKHEYATAYAIRVKAGHRMTWWAQKTRFMAEEKSLADFMDSK